ncbi:MAG: hypothetical protein ABI970_13695 [Chloroflexota bacterium]
MLVITTGVVTFAGIQRGVQAAYPPILYGETSNLSLYKMSIGCSSFWSICKPSERLILEGMYTFPLAEWSPNGQTIAVHVSDGWLIYPTECLLVLRTCDPVPVKPAVQDIRVAWGPDGITIASYETSRTINATIQTSGCWQGDSPCLANSIFLSDYYLLTEMAWSADGRRMAFSDRMQTGLVWLDTSCFDKSDCSKDLHIVPVGASRSSWPSLSPDGRSAVLMMDTSSSGKAQQLFKVDLDSGISEQITFRPGTAEFPDWSADGRYILFSGFATARSGDLIIYLMDMNRHLTLPLMWHEGRDLAFATWGHPAN